MNFHRFWTMFKARNREFYRDKSSFGWSFVFPFLIVIGFGLVFGGERKNAYIIGLFSSEHQTIEQQIDLLPTSLTQMKYLQFVKFTDEIVALDKLKHHKVDMVIQATTGKYWITSTSPKGYTAEQYYLSALNPNDFSHIKQEIEGNQIRYIDWLFPGILAMNMMFSVLWGVGYIVVRYRKNGVLKRLKATPLEPIEYLAAQVCSRVFVLIFTLTIVWTGCNLIFDFYVEGSYFLLAFLFLLGGASLTSLGLMVACRGTSEELTSGILNFLTWPMMFLSEVWFSIEQAPEWIKLFSKMFPLTHMLTAVRKVMNDGAGVAEVGLEISILLTMTFVFISIGAFFFTWNGK